MKKFLPSIILACMFSTIVVIQMSLSGRVSNASKIEEEKSIYSLFESNYQSLNLVTSKNTNHKMNEVKQPIVILNFWASWCLPCVAEFKSLNKLIGQFSVDELLVIGINNDDETPQKAVKKMEDKYELKFESVIDDTLASKFMISRIPASIVFYKGKVIHYVNEEFDFANSSFIQKLKKALKE
jgi:thiol-disulfide isomerase/thioredoxin